MSKQNTEIRSCLVWFSGEEVEFLKEKAKELGNSDNLIKIDYINMMRVLARRGIDVKFTGFINSTAIERILKDTMHGKSFLMYTVLRDPEYWKVP